MERVAFLIEQTNERLVGLLNPESLILRRTAGIQTRQNATGILNGAGLADDPLIYTAGGRTELDLDLLFDVSLAGSTIVSEDVRDLTAPLWNLAENTTNGYPPLVRFVWGKHWNIPGVIISVAEHLEDFSAVGAPRRSWLRMRLLRARDAQPVTQQTNIPIIEDISLLEEDLTLENMRFHEVLAGERLDEIASRFYGDAGYWRVLADFNDLIDPALLPAGLVLVIPSAVVSQLLMSFQETSEITSVSFSSLLRVRPVLRMSL
jgi:hypothetical protein